jgi:hypothetical protein
MATHETLKGAHAWAVNTFDTAFSCAAGVMLGAHARLRPRPHIRYSVFAFICILGTVWSDLRGYFCAAHVRSRRLVAGAHARLRLPLFKSGSTVKCVLDSDAHTFSYSVDGGAVAVAFEGLPAGRALYPAVFVNLSSETSVRVLSALDVPHVRFVFLHRVMCQAGSAGAAFGARDDAVAWLCERAPLWVVVHVCALLRD